MKTAAAAAAGGDLSPTERDVLTGILWGLGGVYLLVVFFGVFNMDEFEHTHATWYVVQGKRPFTEFFEHHHPLLWYALAPFLWVVGEKIAFLFVARLLMFGCGVLTFWATFRIARRLFGSRVAHFAVVFMGLFFYILQAHIEIRPDVPLTTCLMWALERHFASLESKRWQDTALAGVLCAVGFLFLQKAVFILGPLLIVVTLDALHSAFGRLRFGIMGLAFFAALIPYAFYLLVTGQFETYVLFNWWLNMNLDHHAGFIEPLRLSFRRDFLIWLLAGVGLVVLFARHRRRWATISFGVVALGLFAHLLLIPVVYRHYLLPIVPFFGVLAALALGWLPRALAWATVGAGIVLFCVGFSVESFKDNHEGLRAVRTVYEKTTANDQIFNLDYPLNLFRADMDFFWFGFQPNNVRDTWYRRIGKTPDDMKAIFNNRPAMVMALGHKSRHPVLKDFYEDTGATIRYKRRTVRIYQRRANPAAP
jgi:hypothetical protein